MSKLKKFIFKGIYYPVIGNSNGWVSHGTKQILERRFGGWENYDKWWSFSVGIKCRITSTDYPYKQFVIDAINSHPQMVLEKDYFNDTGYVTFERGEIIPKDTHYLWSVKTPKGKYIGDIRDAYYITNLNDLRTHREDGNQICAGWNAEEQKAYGWSHRAKVGFSKGDKIFEEEFGDDNTQFNQHGTKTIETYDDAMLSAVNFANSVA